MKEDSIASDADQLRDLLVVEDNPGDRRLVEEAFAESGHDTTLHVVSTGEAALDFVHRRGEHDDAPRPDAVLLDWSLPQVDGEEVLAELSADFPEIPVVVMTGSRPREEVMESMTSLADTYLTKPTEPDAYLDVVQTLTRL